MRHAETDSDGKRRALLLRKTTIQKQFDQLRDAVRYTDPDLLPFVDQLQADWTEHTREMFRLWRPEDEVDRLKADR